MAQILYLSKISRSDIQFPVSLLFTRVRDPDTDYYKNLNMVMKYIQYTIGLPLILSIKNSGNIKWYIDAAFAAQKYTRRHNCGLMAMGTGGAYVQYTKKLSTKI